MKKPKRAFLLLEVVIAICLLTILFGSLAYLHRRLCVSRRQQKVVYKTFLDEHQAYVLLRSIFDSVKKVQVTQEIGQEGPSCCFMFDRGVYRDPELSGQVRGELIFSHQENHLELIVHSLTVPDKSERIVVLDGVKQVEFMWLHGTRMAVKVLRETPLGAWHLLEYHFSCEA